MSETPVDLEIDDPENYSSSERLRHIYDARRQLRQMRTEAATHRHARPGRAAEHYRTGVESYLLELDTLMRQHEPGPEILYERDFGTVKVHPPGGWEQKRYGAYYINKDLKSGNTPTKIREIPEPKKIELTGLQSLLELPSPIKHTFEAEAVSSTIGDTVKFSSSTYIGWESLNRMVSAMNEFVSQLGLGLDVDDQDEWKI
jgi:hypothetical protein